MRIEPDGVEAAADWASLGSPETYVGYGRAVGFASPGGVVPDAAPRVLGAGRSLRRNEWAVSGELGDRSWCPRCSTSPAVRSRTRFHARDVHLVMGPPAGQPPVRFRVRLDGEPPGPAHGVDVDERGDGTADYQRMYQLIRQPLPIGDRHFEIEFLDAGVEALRVHLRVTQQGNARFGHRIGWVGNQFGDQSAQRSVSPTRL